MSETSDKPTPVDSYWRSLSQEPVAPKETQDDAYWKGILVGSEGEQDYSRGFIFNTATSRDGTVSARARELYASEALRGKDHVVAGLLAIFLGMFGIHKFYLGCNQAAFVMLAVTVIFGLLTFGLAAAVMAALAAMEGIIYLTRSQTEFDELYVVNQRDWF